MCDRNQAIKAMLIAEMAAAGVGPEHRLWPHLVGFAAEVNMTAELALRLASRELDSAPPGVYVNPSGQVQNLQTGQWCYVAEGAAMAKARQRN